MTCLNKYDLEDTVSNMTQISLDLDKFNFDFLVRLYKIYFQNYFANRTIKLERFTFPLPFQKDLLIILHYEFFLDLGDFTCVRTINFTT